MFNKSAKLTTKERNPILPFFSLKRTHQNYETHKTTSPLICFSSKIENSTNIIKSTKLITKERPFPVSVLDTTLCDNICQ